MVYCASILFINHNVLQFAKDSVAGKRCEEKLSYVTVTDTLWCMVNIE